jgi:tetratricopeptide (TPR) repeat protein
VELELGLFDEAAEKFNRVLDREDSSSHAIAAYGQGVALLSVAKRDTQDGKAGSAFANIKQAIDGFESSSKAFGCTRKLLGDLYSFGAGLPPDVFLDKNAEEKVSTEEMLKAQLSFICKGEDAYRSAVDCQIAPDEVELAILQASVISDIGANILLQAQLFSVLHNMGSGSDSDMNDCYDRASKEFRKSMDVNPMHAPAWCGLGCAVAANDPLLAQHAFCRCLELDKMFPDAYANVGFLYTSHESYNASESVMDALTQVADTPMMWMNRAFMLERGASKNLTLENGSEAHSNISRAADAYRAALQVMKHPSAMLGLSLTCRVAPTTESVKNEQALHLSRSLRRKESSAHMQEYLGTTCSSNHAVSLFAGVMVLEKGSENETAWSSTLIEEGKESIENVLVVKGLDATLDISAIRECIQSEQHVEKEKAKSSQPFDSSISLARQIVHEPNRADLWLSWAKELAQSKAPVPLALKSKSNRPLDPAMAAAKRASNMLTRQIVQPCMQGKLSASVDAQMASEALSLIFWLRQIEPEEIVVNTSDNEEPKEEEEKEEEQAPKDESPFDLQRSLLMCPNNKLARHALKLSS